MSGEITPAEAFAAGGLHAMHVMAGPSSMFTFLPGREPGQDGLATAEDIAAMRDGKAAAPAGPPLAHEHDDESPAPRRNCPACKANVARTVAGPTGPDGPAWMAD